MIRLPQVLVNVPGVDKARAGTDPGAARGGRRGARPSWATSGRVLLRPSGTEALVRVMVEAETYDVGRTPWPSASPTSSKSSLAL